MGKREEAWVTVRRFDDPMAAEITQQFLRDHGVPVSVLGNSGSTSVLNRFTTILDIRLTVPAGRVADAREALEALEASSPDHPFRGRVPAPSSEPFPKHKSAPAAFILACLVPIGGGHFYAQHPAGAIILGAGIVGGYMGAIVGARPELLAASALLVAADAVFSVFAVKRHREGRIPSEGAQRAAALAAVVLAFAFALR
jgi:Putative prokaryotic signal transducing protein